ncbi:hypothetical protein BDN70DRAFT_845719 [Pholiota conissans]|uniref:Uncharacterized protein n=1 Tax=Pholiota conissans TaxID=109636 RepID=A0A9P5YLF8_9AGAR|nr:hypothetical protein BDN70DRAFT_845719 [Pholiota conissans]
MIGERIFFNWPFLQEGLVVAVSDSLLKYEKLPTTPNAPARVTSTSHGERWQMKAERIERHYSTRYGVILGDIELLLHIRPLKGLKQSASGAFIKNYAEGSNNEIEQAVQMCLGTGISEDPRYQEREASSLAEEFPEGSTIFLLEESAYGTVGKVSSTTKSTLSADLDVYPSDNSENNDFRAIVIGRKSSDYYSFYNAANLARITTLALAKIASSFLVITSDGAKSNLGLSLKFDAKGLKVIGYSQKSESGKWDYSQKTIDLVKEYKTKFPEVFHVLDYKSNGMIPASEIFTGPDMDADTKVREIRKWLQTKGVLDFEPVPLICDKLTKETIAEIESLADKIVKKKSSVGPKEIIITDIHRQAVLKPSQAIYRLQDQRFALGDRVIMVQDSGSVPLAVKGVVVGLYEESIDVVWDVPIMLGGTLGGCCSQYRGSTVEFNTCLNLSDPQFIFSTKPKTSPHPRNEVPLFRPQYGARTAIQTVVGQAPVARLRAATQPNPSAYAPNSPNGRGEPLRPGQSFQWPNSPHAASTQSGGAYVPPHLHGGRGGAQGGFVPEHSGRGGFQFNGDRGRGSPMSWRGRDFGGRTTGRGSYLR